MVHKKIKSRKVTFGSKIEYLEKLGKVKAIKMVPFTLVLSLTPT